MSFRVGIATYILNYNYGSALQAYALTEYIRLLGYDAYILDCLDMSLPHNRKMRFRTYRRRILGSLLSPALILESLRRKHISQSVVRETEPEKIVEFQRFYTTSMNISKDNYLQEKSFDTFVCGSDQVWKLTVPGLHDFFFLRFAPLRKRIAYAPSFGSDYIPNYNRRRLNTYLRSFASISIRETSGVKLIKEEIGLDVQQVLDPVLLVGCEFWRKKYTHDHSRSAYVLCYLLNENDICNELSEQIAVNNNVEYSIWITSGFSAPMGARKLCPSPIDLVQLIDEALAVITDSFHGMILSALMNTNFYVIDRNYESSPEQGTRIESFLEMSGLESRRITGMQIPPLKTDFAICNKILSEKQEISSKYLSEALAHSIHELEK